VDNAALLVVDLGAHVADRPWARALREPVAGEIAYHRGRGRPVLYACETKGPDDDPRHALWPELAPDPLDPVVRKRGYSAFHGAELDGLLRERGIGELWIVGVETHTGVLFTAADACSRGLPVTVPETCVAASDEELHGFALRELRDVLRPYAR